MWRASGLVRRYIVSEVDVVRWLRRMRDTPAAVDAVVGVVVVGGVLGRGVSGSSDLTWAVFVAAGLAGAALFGRRWFPGVALALAAAAAVLLVPAGMSELGVIAVGFAGYQVGLVSERRTVVVATVAAVVGISAGAIGAEGAFDVDSEGGPLPPVAAAVTSVALGYAVHTRRELAQAQQAQAERRAMQQRLHIARELHDAVGHNVAVINVQAGVAAQLLRTKPDSAEEALDHVLDASSAVLDELAAVLRVLRAPNAEPADTEPAPRMADLGNLVESYSAAGAAVEWKVSGQRRELPSSVELAVYRMIQESLTNAAKHGDGMIRLHVTWAPTDLVVEVRNPMERQGSTAGGAAPGFGLVGMRERITAAGGTFHAGRQPAGDFVVQARVPATAGEQGT